MNSKRTLLIILAVMLVLLIPVQSRAFESGSTGADGAFNPTADTVLQMPEDGIFNFTTVNIPAGVTVTFKKNSKNTPVYILATGDVIIEGTIGVDGGDATNQIPGEGGPGGFDGGPGSVFSEPGGNGLGPGGGEGGPYISQKSCPTCGLGGGGGGYGTAGNRGCYIDSGQGGTSYGNSLLQPIVGGSGGGGGSGGKCSTNIGAGGGGGGGGGAIVIASSTKIVVNGTITANGGNGDKGSCYSAGGGGGSGGAIRLIAPTISGNGIISAVGGKSKGVSSCGIYCCFYEGGNGGLGRIRLEAEHIAFASQTTPPYSVGRPSSVFIAEVPELRIVEVGGVAVPQNPTGRFGTPDVTLPFGTQNPVSVKIVASKIPAGTVVKLTSTPEHGPVETATGTLTGTFDSSTTTIDINLSTEYQCILTAEATFTMQTTMYFDGEKIEKVRVAGSPGSGSKVTYITETGREVKAEEVLARVTYHLP